MSSSSPSAVERSSSNTSTQKPETVHTNPNAPPPQDQLSAGILLSGDTIPAWQKRAIEKMVARTDVEITHLVIRTNSSPNDLDEYLFNSFPDGLYNYLKCCHNRLQSHALWSLLGVLRQLARTPDYRRPKRIDSISGLSDAKRIYCPAIPTSGFGNHLPDSVTNEVGMNTDVVIRFGFGILTDPLLSMPTHGVLSFHRGNLRTNRGQPGGLWEFLNDEPTAGVTLQRIGDSLDAGEIVVEKDVDISTAHTWREVERRQLAVCEEMLAIGIERLQDSTYESTPPDSLGELYTIPHGKENLRYLKKTILGNLRALTAVRIPNSYDAEERRTRWSADYAE